MLYFNCIRQKSGPLAAALMAVLLLSSAGTAQAYECKSTYKSAEAIAPTKAQSTAAVKVIWHNTVNDIYGLQWSAWDIAKSKRIVCSDTGNNQWCRARAKPCLYVIN
jgi:hypothetical protein